MKLRCPEINCNSHQNQSPDRSLFVRKGFYFRRSDSKKIRRYRCTVCHRSFSQAGLSLARYQKVRRITPLLNELICSGVSQRRAAKILDIDRKTVVRRIGYIAKVAEMKELKYRNSFPSGSISTIEFDDLETSEHTKCKPLSVTIAVEPKSRKILGFQVSQMPAKGKLSKISIKKYGYRKDLRHEGWNALLKSLKSMVAPQAVFTSDENPHYPKYLKRHFPHSTHKQVPGGRGAITGQGELKKKRFDPIFSLNHTCAMLRANLNRLFRRTWCTTKTKQGLINHLLIYVHYHNKQLTKSCPLKGAS